MAIIEMALGNTEIQANPKLTRRGFLKGAAITVATVAGLSLTRSRSSTEIQPQTDIVDIVENDLNLSVNVSLLRQQLQKHRIDGEKRSVKVYLKGQLDDSVTKGNNFKLDGPNTFVSPDRSVIYMDVKSAIESASKMKSVGVEEGLSYWFTEAVAFAQTSASEPTQAKIQATRVAQDYLEAIKLKRISSNIISLPNNG